MIDASWSCPYCEMSFPTFDQIEKHKVIHGSQVMDQSQSVQSVTPELVQKKTVKEIPVTLTYKYTGTCGSYRSQVETILIDLEGKKSSQVAVAWCLMCKKKVEERTVSSL